MKSMVHIYVYELSCQIFLNDLRDKFPWISFKLPVWSKFLSACLSCHEFRKLIQESFPRISRPHVKFFISELYFFLLTAAVPKFKSALDSGLWFADFRPDQNWDFNSNKWMLWKFSMIVKACCKSLSNQRRAHVKQEIAVVYRCTKPSNLLHFTWYYAIWNISAKFCR